MGTPGWTATEDAAEVRCRYKGGFWGLVGLGALFAAAGLVAPWTSAGSLGTPAASAGLSLLLGGPYLLATLWGAVILVKSEVIADAAGLRWRKTGAWSEARWADVTDYCDYRQPSTKQTSSPQTDTVWVQVKTRSGTLKILPAQWTNLDRLRARIADSATEAASSGWQAVAGVEQGLPLKCHYDTAINRHTLVWMDRLHVYGLAVVAIYFGWQWRTTHTLPGWGWLVTPTGLFVIGKQTLPLLLRPTYRETQKRLGQKIVADENGLTFTDASGESRVAWADVSDFYWEGMRHVIVTPGGERDFIGTLTDAERLRMVIPKLAVRAGQTRWRSGTPLTRRVRRANGEETTQRVYRYRTQENCGRLWMVTLGMTFVGLMSAGPALTSLSGGTTPGVRELALVTGSVSGLLFLVCAWGAYWTCSVRVGEEGVTQRGLFERFLPWDQVCGFRWRGVSDLTWGYVESRYGRLWFWKGIGDGDRLAAEIAARAGAEKLTASAHEV